MTEIELLRKEVNELKIAEAERKTQEIVRLKAELWVLETQGEFLNLMRENIKNRGDR